MTIKEWQEKIYKTAVEKGWYDKSLPQKNSLEFHMLMVSEIAEATEEVRKGTEPIYFENNKPEGEAIELADCVIRIMDYFEHRGWNLEKTIKIKTEYNDTRPYRHGGKTK